MEQKKQKLIQEKALFQPTKLTLNIELNNQLSRQNKSRERELPHINKARANSQGVEEQDSRNFKSNLQSSKINTLEFQTLRQSEINNGETSSDVKTIDQPELTLQSIQAEPLNIIVQNSVSKRGSSDQKDQLKSEGVKYSEIKAKMISLNPVQDYSSRVHHHPSTVTALDQANQHARNYSLNQPTSLQQNLALNSRNFTQRGHSDLINSGKKRHQNQSVDWTTSEEHERRSYLTNQGKYINDYHIESKQLLIDDIASNKYRHVTQVLSQFLKEKQTFQSVSNRQDQQRKRTVKNTFQTETQRLRSISPRGKSQSTTERQGDASVRAKSLIKIPKDIILYQISRNTDQNTIDRILDSTLNEESVSRQKEATQDSYLDYLERGSIQVGQAKKINQTSRNADSVNRNLSSFLEINQQNNDTSVRLPISSTPLHQAFQITDLLERSFRDNANPQKAKAIVDYYKRSVKGEVDFEKPKEIMIRNYRLHSLMKESDLPQSDRDLLGLNYGTSIYVSNSLIKPEIFKFSTKVSSTITEVYSFMNEQTQQKKGIKRQEQIEQYDSDDESLFLTKLEMINIDKNEAFKQTVPPLNLQINKTIKEEDGDMMSVNSQEQISIYLSANQTFDELLNKWFSSLGSKKSSLHLETAPKEKAKPQLSDSPRIREINAQILKKEGRPTQETELPIDKYSQKSSYPSESYSHLKAQIVETDVKSWFEQFIHKTMCIKLYSEKADQSLQTINYAESK